MKNWNVEVAFAEGSVGSVFLPRGVVRARTEEAACKAAYRKFGVSIYDPRMRRGNVLYSLKRENMPLMRVVEVK